jgi:hypothetical protein
MIDSAYSDSPGVINATQGNLNSGSDIWKSKFSCRIWGSHSDGYGGLSFLGYNAG